MEPAERILVADNSQVIQQWEGAGGQAPQIISEQDGGTRIEWHGGIAWDKYVNESTGGDTLTPQRNGSFYTAQVTSDLRGTGPGGDISYFQFAGTHTNDRAVLSNPSQISVFRIGRVGQGYKFEAGDVVANFSTLGANTPMRGLYGEGFLEKVYVGVSAGIISESWETLANTAPRTRYLRNAYAAKVDLPMGESTHFFATSQGYSDDSSSGTPGTVAGGTIALAAADGRNTTLGFNHQQGQFSLQGEVGTSYWKEAEQQSHNDQALVLDGGYQLSTVKLPAGNHDIGTDYPSISAGGGAGVKETYINASWPAKSWLTLNADLRHSENKADNSSATDSGALNAIINIEAVPGLSSNLAYSESNGKNSDGGRNTNKNHGAGLNYAYQSWNGGVNFQQSKLTNSGASASNSTTDTWSYLVGKTWSDANQAIAASWNLNLNLGFGTSRQDLDSGASTNGENTRVNLTAQHVRWGNLTAAYGYNTISSPTDGSKSEQRQYQIETAHSFDKQNRTGIKFYWQRSESFTGAAFGYTERKLGFQLSYSL
ncbi:MAG: hypothetical protein Q7U07_05765 [Gammaproteobacteria bacterium]|nr:hypothetical protein [Gammaproteobacteria bacterium]